jgi:P-type conjugative transfer protein TrbL
MNAAAALRTTPKIVFTSVVLCCLLSYAVPAEAQIANIAMVELYVAIQTATEGWLAAAGEIALHLLAVTAVIGFAIGMKDLILAGNGGVTLDAIVALLVRYAFIVGLLVWLLSAPIRLTLITSSIKKIGAAISGQDMSFGGLMSLFSEVVNPLVGFTEGLGIFDTGLLISLALIIFIINCVFLLIATTVLMVEIEGIFILIGGLFTAPFFAIGYFREYFLGYIKALVSVGVKMLMLCLCLGIIKNIMSSWPGLIATALDLGDSVFAFLMPMACATIGFYVILKAVPQFASSLMSGGVSGLDGGAVKAAAMAGVGLGMTVYQVSRSGAKGVVGAASVGSQTMQSYQQTSQAARDTGSTPGAARVEGVKAAFGTLMTAQPQPLGVSRGVANSGNANTMSAPSPSRNAASASSAADVGKRG